MTQQLPLDFERAAALRMVAREGERGGFRLVVREHYPHTNGSPQSVHSGGKRGRATGLSASLAAHEARIRGRASGEEIVILNPDGSVHGNFVFEGDPDGAGPAGGGGAMPFEDWSGKTVTHNHPADPKLGANGLSSTDIKSAVRANAAEVRAVTADGRDYSLKPGPNGWTDTPLMTSMGVDVAFYGEQLRLSDRVSAGEITLRQANTLWSDNSVRALADMNGWTYTVTGA